jgi:bifunctional ADP-heptose synthase (sugar kinase/adenylyltransferase)
MEIPEVKKYRVLVVGDIMLDRYVHVETHRRAQEVPIPVWDEVSRETRLGGAANLANNLKAIGGDDFNVDLLGLAPGDSVFDALRRAAGFDSLCINVNHGMEKTRYVSEGTIFFRSDNMTRFRQRDADELASMFYRFEAPEKDYDAVVVSDYDKGTVTPRLVSMLTRFPVRFVDSKRRDLRTFKSFDVLKVNEHEFSEQVSNREYPGPFEALFDNVIVTKGAFGAELRKFDPSSTEKRYLVHCEDFPLEGSPRDRDVTRPVDVTGCGDTHTAAMLVSYLKTGDIRLAVRFANRCASAKVRKFGTGVPEESLT